jgi:hypothetical protein
MAVLWCLLPVAAALTLPPGWSAAGPNRALLDPAQPERGELREFVVHGGSGDPDELLLTLRATGLQVTAASPDGNAVSLAIGGGLGRARSRVESGSATWALVMASNAYAANLDPDAILTVALSSQAPTWGAAAATGGGTGQPWVNTPAAGWEAVGAGSAFGVVPELVGTWEGTVLIDGAAITYAMRFVGTGELSISRRARKGKDELRQGTWAAREGLLRMTIPGATGDVVYERVGSTLNLQYDGARLTLMKVGP